MSNIVAAIINGINLLTIAAIRPKYLSAADSGKRLAYLSIYHCCISSK